MQNLLVLVLILMTTQVGAEESLEGQLSCKVTSNFVVQPIDGKAKTFSGITDQFKVGDRLRFYYSFTPKTQTEGPSYICTLSDTIRDHNHILHSANAQTYTFSDISNGLYAETSDTMWGEDAYLTPEAIKCASNDKRLILSRYYKSDYEGVFVRYPVSGDLTTQVVTLDCRTEESSIDEIYRTITVE